MEELSELFSKGQRLGKYQLIRRLAVGGMAEIYLAQVSGLEGFEKLVVLKRILPQHALDPQLRRMFLDEARLMATLTHPHVTQVYDVGSEGDAPFFAMEYVHGANLREIMNAAARAVGLDHQTREIPLHHAIGILASAAAGLHFAHEQTGPKGEPLNIVHRDVSPSNVLVTYGGSVKVSDFGIAKWSSQRTQTQEGALKGKFAYMSPEQCRGVALDRRSDVFALGTLLYELTTGKPPFRAVSDYEILNRIVNGELPPPTMSGGPYPPDLERIVRRALALGPNDRYPTAQALQLDLEAFARAQGLVVSTVALGEYMHTLFAQRIGEWQRAQQSGKSLKQHLAEIEALSARLEPSSQPTATDLHALPPDRARRRDRRVPVLAAAALAIVVAGGITVAWQAQRLQVAGRRADNAERLGGLRVRAAGGASAAAAAPAGESSPSTPGAVPHATTAGGGVAAATAARPSTAPSPRNTVESHPESLPAPSSSRPRRASRAHVEGVEVDPAPAGVSEATATAKIEPERSNPRSKALKDWDPDSPVPP
jgi:serine/threonine protein kinase